MDNPAETHCTLAVFEALQEKVSELTLQLMKLQYKVDLMEPLSPGRLPSAEEFDALSERVTKLENMI